jgi:Zn-dependent M32 family carboxypeptidase
MQTSDQKKQSASAAASAAIGANSTVQPAAAAAAVQPSTNADADLAASERIVFGSSDEKKAAMQQAVAMLAADAAQNETETAVRNKKRAEMERLNEIERLKQAQHLASLAPNVRLLVNQAQTTVARDAANSALAEVQRREAVVQALIEERNAILAQLQAVCTHEWTTKGGGEGDYAWTATYCVKCFKQ